MEEKNKKYLANRKKYIEELIFKIENKKIYIEELNDNQINNLLYYYNNQIDTYNKKIYNIKKDIIKRRGCL